MSRSEVASFNDALRIFPTNAQVHEYNKLHMERLNTPCVIVSAAHHGKNAESATSSKAGNLHREIPMCSGARVMLLENIWTEKGLVNGAMGVVHDIVWSANVTEPRQEAPSIIMVRIPSYSGPPVHDDPEMADVVPIFRSKRDFLHKGQYCNRTQFPLTIAYAITAHKSQGCTLDRAVMDISQPDFAPGLTYVMISRVKTLEGLMFDTAFHYDKFKPPRNPVVNPRETH